MRTTILRGADTYVLVDAMTSYGRLQVLEQRHREARAYSRRMNRRAAWREAGWCALGIGACLLTVVFAFTLALVSL